MRAFCLVFLITINTACFGQGLSALSPEQRVAAAVLPLPPVLRDHASVIELDKQGAPVTIRKGTNGMVCMLGSSLAEFDACCYHASFMPLILRVRQLYARGQKLEEADVDKDIDNDVKGKKLTLPDHPTAGYRMLGPRFEHGSPYTFLTKLPLRLVCRLREKYRELSHTSWLPGHSGPMS